MKRAFVKAAFVASVILGLLLYGFAPVATAQNSLEVKGSVTDSEGEPLIGVTVLEVGTSNGTVTDFAGDYSLTVEDANSSLSFSYTGYETHQVVVGNQSVLDVQLLFSASELGEVVVVGYGTQRKSDLTGSLVSAPLDAFREAPNTNILQALSGSTPGISIGQTSQAGQEPDIQIRGQTSINGNQNPLIILDGVYYRGRISDLNPRDIASVDVLKDASSKAVYGAQAANGVILITTKSGRQATKPVITYSGFYSTQSPANELTPWGREGFLQGVRDIDWQNSYLGPGYTQQNPDWTIENNTGLFPPLLEGFANGTDFNWYDEVTDPGYITDHQLSVRGSSEKSSYYLSGGYTDQEGWMLNDQYNRISARINFDVDITDWLTIGANTFGAFADRSGESPILSQLPQMSPLAAPRDANGEFIINPLGDLRLNPFLQSASDDRDLRNNLSGIFFARVKIPQIKGLSYRVNFSNNYTWDALSNSNPFDAGQSGRAIKVNRSTYDVLLDNILQYDRKFGANHGVNITVLYGANKIRFEESIAEGTNFSNLALSYNSLEQAVIQQISSAAWEETYLYQMARINYDFQKKYLLTATIRRDGFSGFAENNKIGWFPSVGLGWILSEERFLKDGGTFSFLKLRASYGINGNLTSRYSSLAQVSASAASQYVFGDGGSTVNGQQISALANPNLTWERTAGINIGLDFGILGGNVSGSIDHYRSTTTDLLWDFVLPEITGFRNIASNIGEIANSGVELLVNANLIRGDKFSWDLGVNLAANNNRIESLLGLDLDEDGREDNLIANGLFIGEPIGTIYGYVIDGIWQIGEGDIPNGFAPGQYKLRDLNGDGQITPQDDRQILGRSEPAYEFGIRNTLQFGDLTFRFFIKSIQGGSEGYLGENNPWAGSYSTPGNAQSSNWFSEIDYWTPSNPGATYRIPGPDAAIGGRRYFARNFVRLQDISLAYQLGDQIVEKLGVQGLKIFVSGKNLVTLTDWEGWDPETGQGLGATQGLALPVMRGVTFGLDLSL